MATALDLLQNQPLCCLRIDMGNSQITLDHILLYGQPPQLHQSRWQFDGADALARRWYLSFPCDTNPYIGRSIVGEKNPALWSLNWMTGASKNLMRATCNCIE